MNEDILFHWINWSSTSTSIYRKL